MQHTNRTLDDLEGYLHAVALCYFEPGQLDGVWIRWAPWRGTHGGRLAAYHPDTRTIRICKRLAWAWVPDWYVCFVVFHEALHHVHGRAPRATKGRDRWHTEAFRAAERQFFWFGRVAQWEAEHGGLLACEPPPGVANG